MLLASLCVVICGAVASAAESGGKLNVLIVTGGHGFEQEPFFKVFKDNAEITFTHATQGKTSEAYERADLLGYDVVVLYDMVQKITESQKAAFHSLFDKGIGLVVMHHALCSYQDWPDYERIIGGKYFMKDERRGDATIPKSDFQHDVEMPIKIVAKDHPITAGLKDFTIFDEIYIGFRAQPDVTPLITTTQPKSGNPLAWTRTQGKSRVVYLQLGHGPSAYNDPNYRRLVAQSIRYAANKPGDTGWISLFDGKTLDGWIQRGGKAKYRVEDSEIVGMSVPNTPNSFLCTRREFTNFVLELEFKVAAGLNSGVQIRSHCFDDPTELTWNGKPIKILASRVHGYQVEIDPSDRAWTGGVYDEGRRGWLNDLKNNEAGRKAFKAREWNQFRIECRGDSIKTWLNSVPAADLNDGLTPAGFIALQVHGVGKSDKTLEVRFRNIRLKEL
jgi:type 1 glutamine amidotransferase